MFENKQAFTLTICRNLTVLARNFAAFNCWNEFIINPRFMFQFMSNRNPMKCYLKLTFGCALLGKATLGSI